jgi:hypothetical protein
MPAEPQAGAGSEETKPSPGSGASQPGKDGGVSQSSRAGLANELDQQAEGLLVTHRRLLNVWADAENARNVWIGNLEDVKQCILDLRKLLERCEDATKADSSKSLSEAIRQFEADLGRAKQTTEAAFRSLEVPDSEGQFLKQSELHSESIEQLRKLSSRCKGLAPYLRGTHPLP